MSWTKREQKGFFADKEKITRKELIQALREDKGFVPGFVGENLRRSERVGLVPAVFDPKKYPKEIRKWQFEKEISRLSSRMRKTEDEKIRASLEKKVKYLKKLSGV